MLGLFDWPFQLRWCFDVELLARLLGLQTRGRFDVPRQCVELPLDQWEDASGSSSRLRQTLQVLSELARLRVIVAATSGGAEHHGRAQPQHVCARRRAAVVRVAARRRRPRGGARPRRLGIGHDRADATMDARFLYLAGSTGSPGLTRVHASRRARGRRPDVVSAITRPVQLRLPAPDRTPLCLLLGSGSMAQAYLSWTLVNLAAIAVLGAGSPSGRSRSADVPRGAVALDRAPLVRAGTRRRQPLDRVRRLDGTDDTACRRRARRGVVYAPPRPVGDQRGSRLAIRDLQTAAQHLQSSSGSCSSRRWRALVRGGGDRPALLGACPMIVVGPDRRCSRLAARGRHAAADHRRRTRSDSRMLFNLRSSPVRGRRAATPDLSAARLRSRPSSLWWLPPAL